jgi:hypothetical protein
VGDFVAVAEVAVADDELGTPQPQPQPFRDMPAFTKAARERYGIGPDTRVRLDV